MKTKLFNYIPIVLMTIIAVIVGYLLLEGDISVEDIIKAVDDNKWLTIAVIMLLFAVKGVAIVLPYPAVCVATALVFDVRLAVIINFFGTILCIAVSYFVGYFSKSLTLDKVLAKKPKFKKYFANAQDYSFTFCFAVHASHASTEIQGVLFGLLRTPFWTYIASSMLALFPSMTYFTVLGNRFDLTNPWFWFLMGLDAIVVIVGVIYFRKNIIKGGKKTEET